ncbi:ABC transporter ATP-binding protein [Biomaibacter acetigenes]|uniref:ABC transporter ATP-binding protein n=1 Tax=Biomaibacter acetigenes TaxID=2316383 RepID=A0A3G2R3T6_9FIRM|nr:ABC transporter ATP-binding protein [Biomaibacter acetigenes]AYO29788.1 ABC transporter ATP-binding protein [Biomaibacter acetigenes]
MNNDVLIDIKNLKTYFYMDEGVVPAVDGVSFKINKGKTLGLVGESGCGKSVTALSILKLIPSPPGRIVEGEIIFEGQDLVKKSADEMCAIRGNDIAMIFQEPMTSLNPVYTVGKQVAESLKIHRHLTPKEAEEKTLELFNLVGIPDPKRRLNNYPHQLSGGLRQRVMIAMALACNPKLLIADEPTTALDVTIQAQILRLIKQLQEKINMSVLMITHDLGVIAEVSDDVCVMYAGTAVEYADVYTIFDKPLHPYTIGLYNSIPKLSQDENKKLFNIPGVVPNLLHLPEGCRFWPRCGDAKDICRQKNPEFFEAEKGHRVKCWKYQK